MAFQKKTTPTEKSAGDQIQIFATCGNFPKDRAGLEALADALESAAKKTGVEMKAIIDACSTGGSWCPTPYDLLQAAVKIKGEVFQGFAGCSACGGTGWKVIVKGDYEYAGRCDCRKVSA